MSFATQLQSRMVPAGSAETAAPATSGPDGTAQPSGMTLADFNAAYDKWVEEEKTVGRGPDDPWLDPADDPHPAPAGFDFKQGRERALYGGVASGLVSLQPSEFGALLSDGEGLLSQFEFDLLPADVQAKARNNPQQYMRSVLAYRNPANGDLGSVGAEGGFSDYDTATWDDQLGMVPDRSKYLQVHDEGLGWVKVLGTVLQFTPLAPLGLALSVGASFHDDDPIGALTSIAGAAGITPGLSAAAGDALGVGKTASDAIAAGSLAAGGTALRGGGFGDVLTAGVTGAASSAIGNTVTDVTGSREVGSLASRVGSGLINTALQDSRPDRRNTVSASNADVSRAPRITGQNLNLGWMTR